MFNRKESGVKIRGEKTDIWALGVTLYYMLTGIYPTNNAKDLCDLKEKITKQPIDFSIIKNEWAKQILMKMLDKDQENRASLDDMLQSDWVTNGNTVVVEFDVETDEVDEKGTRKGFGHINRLLTTKMLR